MEEEEGLVKGISFIFFLVLLTPITSSWAAVFKLPMEAVKEVFPEAREVEIKNIILGGGEKMLSPERRFDAAILSTPDIFN